MVLTRLSSQTYHPPVFVDTAGSEMLAIARRNPLLVILCCALIVRVAAALFVQDRLDRVWKRSFVIEGDAGGYWKLAGKLAAGDEFAVYDPPRRVHRMPGFPAVLAASIRMFGPNLLPARLVLAVVGTTACAVVYLLGRELFDRRVGLIAAGLTAFSPVMVGFSVVILSETLFALCMLLSLLALAKLVKTDFTRERRRRAVTLALTAGATIAAACYVRPSWLPAAPMFAAVWLLLADHKKQALLRGLLVLAAVFVLLLPWAYRNDRVTGHWVFTTLWVGPSLYDGLNPEATGGSDMRFFDVEQAGRTMTEYEVDRHYRRRAWEFVKQNPGRAIELAGLKLVRFWKPWPSAPEFDSVPYRLGVAVFFLPAVVLAARGWWIHRRDAWAWLLTLGPAIYFCAVHLVFVASLRYRLPAEYPMYVLSAAGFCDWVPPTRISRKSDSA